MGGTDVARCKRPAAPSSEGRNDPFTKKTKRKAQRTAPQHASGVSLKGRKDNVKKAIVAVLATLAVVWILCIMVGPGMGHVAFHLPVLGWAMTWTVLAFIVVGFLSWRVVKGK